MRRNLWPSDLAQLIRSIRTHCGIQQQALAAAVGKKKAWLSKREVGLAHMTLAQAEDLCRAIITMYKAETIEKNRAKQAILQESDKGPWGQVADKSAG